MKNLLDRILASAEAEDAAATVQMIIAGQQAAGVLGRNPEFEDLYTLHTQGTIQNGRQQQQGMIVWTFPAESVQALLAFQPMESSPIVTPDGKKTPGGIVV